MKKTLLITLSLILGGCATTYQSNGMSGGYSDTQLAPDMFRVNFKGNGYTKMERSKDFVMLRSSELTLQNNYKYFAVLGGNNNTSKSYYKNPTITNVNSNYYGTLNNSNFNAYSNSTINSYGGEISEINRPMSEQIIKCFVEKPNDIYTYDALFIMNSIKTKYDLK